MAFDLIFPFIEGGRRSGLGCVERNGKIMFLSVVN